MKENSDLKDLVGAIESQKAIFDDLFNKIRSYVAEDLKEVERDWKSALVIVGLLANYYTAVETVLFRIAQEFGNQLSTERWHADLLERLNHAVDEIRPRVIQRDAYLRLDELRRFRHFERYYFQTDYDWDKLEFLIKKQLEVHPMVLRDLNAFVDFLRGMNCEAR